MSFDEGEYHAKQIDDWIKRNASGLSSDKLLLFFRKAIITIQQRTAVTLSEVTLAAIFDRVLYTSQKNFSILSEVKVEPDGIFIDSLVARANELEIDEIKVAFRFFMIELFTILGKLTADILTKPLYQELFKVTADRAHTISKGSSDREEE